MTLPQPEIYRDYEIVPQFVYKDIDGNLTGKVDWNIYKQNADYGYVYSHCTLEEVKESIDDLLNQ